MRDSWSPRKLVPGLAAQYSRPSDLMTSIMKSEPARSLLETSTVAGAGFAAADVTACWAMATGGLATSPAAPAAAPLKKPRRSTEIFLDFAMQDLLFLAHYGTWRGCRRFDASGVFVRAVVLCFS